MVKSVIYWLYWIQVALLGAFFLGDIYRGDASLWIVDEVRTRLQERGPGNAAFIAYAYLILYSSAFAFPYSLLVMGLKPPTAKARLLLIFLSSWFAFSWFVFARPIFEFIRNLPWDVWNGGLLILWCSLTFLLVMLWERWSRRKR